jgi:DNA-binding CsgD family transcriptional regulator
MAECGESWRTTSSMATGSTFGRSRRIVSDSQGPFFLRLADRRDGPEREVARREDREELRQLCQTVLRWLSPRQRYVLALWADGTEAKEIAGHLGASERAIRKDLERIRAVTRQHVIARAGHGCPEGEGLISRYSFRLAGPEEARDAHLHLATCAHCGVFYMRLELWREEVLARAAALLPIPALEQAHPGLVERVLHNSADALSSLKQHAGEAGAQAKQQLADAGGLAKQHAAAGYSRAVEYTPLAGVRPGAAATAIVGCLALAGGGAVCVEQGVNPISGLAGIVQPEPEDNSAQPEPSKPDAQQAPDPPQLPTTPPPESPPAPAPTPPEPELVVPAPSRRRRPSRPHRRPSRSSSTRPGPPRLSRHRSSLHPVRDSQRRPPTAAWASSSEAHETGGTPTHAVPRPHPAHPGRHAPGASARHRRAGRQHLLARVLPGRGEPQRRGVRRRAGPRPDHPQELPRGRHGTRGADGPHRARHHQGTPPRRGALPATSQHSSSRRRPAP